MKIKTMNARILDQEPGLEGINKLNEFAGRICYNSYDKISDGSSDKWLRSIVNAGHTSVVEHAAIYLEIPEDCLSEAEKYKNNFYSVVKEDKYVSTNYRVLVDNEWLDDLKWMTEWNEKFEKRVSVWFDVDRITGESFLRHRSLEESHPELEKCPFTIDVNTEINSYSRQSTRYCNYSKEKYSHHVTFIQPYINKTVYNYEETYEMRDVFGDNATDVEWMISCLDAEKHYFALLEKGWPTEYARYALGFSVYSPLVMSGYMKDWKHFFALRSDSHAHQDAQYICTILRKEFENRGLVL